MLSPRQLPVTIRAANPGDESAIARVAALDSSPVPPAPLLIAEVDEEVWAVLSVRSRVVVADPFRPSAPIVGLLRDYLKRAGAQSGGPARARRGRQLIRRLYALESAETSG